MRFGRFMAAAFGAAALFLAGANDAQAESIIVLNGGMTTSGGTTTFTYNVFLTPVNHAESGDFFTIFDFEERVGSASIVSNPAGVSGNFSYPATGVLPAGSPANTAGSLPGLLGDSTGVDNITFTFDATTVSAPANPLGQNLLLFSFEVASTATGTNLDTYVAQDHTLLNAVANNQGNVIVAFSPDGPQTVPVPAAMWGGMALMGLIAGGKLRKKIA